MTTAADDAAVADLQLASHARVIGDAGHQATFSNYCLKLCSVVAGCGTGLVNAVKLSMMCRGQEECQ